MKTQDAVTHFGSKTAVAAALGVSRAAITQWGDQIPLSSALLLERVTGGKLRLNPADYRRVPHQQAA